jgi:hypothetical protein
MPVAQQYVYQLPNNINPTSFQELNTMTLPHVEIPQYSASKLIFSPVTKLVLGSYPFNCVYMCVCVKVCNIPVFTVRFRFINCTFQTLGTAVAQGLKCCATNRKVAGSIPPSVSGFFIHMKSFRSHYGPGVHSASNRNEYQDYFLGVKAAILCRCHKIWEP